MKIPMVDLAAEHTQIADEVRQGFESVMERSAFVLGREVESFEGDFAAFCDAPRAVGVGNGGDALELILRAIGVGPGHEVILPANTFIATALAVVRAGAEPVLVDCDEYFHLRLDQVEARVTSRTRAILAVHLYGQMAPVESLRGMAEDSGVALVEDAAQAHGASRHGLSPAALGTAAGFSFYPSKNLGAYGDGGAVVTHDPDLADRIRRLGCYGSEVKYRHEEIGFNSRLDTLQAVVLSAKLRRLPAWNAARREAAERYRELLAEVDGVTIPTVREGNVHVWHVYVIRVPRRDEVHRRMNEAGIGTVIHYPVPVHLQPSFADLGHAIGAFPESEKASAEVLSLPMFPSITPAQQEEVVEVLRRALQETG